MPVNLNAPNAAAIKAVRGITLGIAKAGIRKPDRKDLLVIQVAEGARVAGVFTRNRMCAAPVILARKHLEQSQASVRALVVNTGNANAGTGEAGLADADAVCREVARLVACNPQQVLPFSTGVIMEPLPVDRIKAGLPACITDLGPEHWLSAAEAIMTTDTVPKAASRQVTIGGERVTITGIAKGSGMIRPDMATMLGFVCTDARMSQAAVEAAVKQAAQTSFNCITVDGDTSTNDSFILVATGQAAGEIDRTDTNEYRALVAAITEVATELAQAIVRDGEGATKFVTVRVEGGASDDECRKVAYAIGHSPLVKTAFYASDPNLGRILCAIGYSGVADLDVERLDLYLDDVHVATRGGRHPGYREEDGQRAMQKSEFTVRVDLHRGRNSVTMWTCDLSHDYVKINAEYRT